MPKVDAVNGLAGSAIRPTMLAVDEVKVGRNRRDPGDVDGLVESIRTFGLTHPITVTGDYRLIAGGRRLKAFKQMGLTVIPAVIRNFEGLTAEMLEIDENLIRLDLTRLERAEQTARRKVIYETLHPDSVGSGRGNTREKRQARERSRAEVDPLPLEEGKVEPKRRSRPFSADAAEKTNQSRTTVDRDARIGEKLTQDVRDLLRSTPLADAREELIRLTRVPAERQVAVVNKVLSGDSKTIAQAIRAVERDQKAQERAARASENAEAAGESAGRPAGVVRHGDALEVMAGIDAGTARLVFADPPYNIGVNYGEGKKADLLEPDQYLRWCEAWMKGCERLLTADGSFWVLISDEWAAEYKLILSRLLAVRQWIIWYESFGQNQQAKFARCHRHLFWCVKDPKRFCFNAEAWSRPSVRQEIGDARADPNGKLWESVWGVRPAIPRLVDNAKERLSEFPTQLPLALVRPIVLGASDPGDLVVDPFTGSGTTGVAALTEGRLFVGAEKSRKYAGLAQERLDGLKIG